MYVLARLSDGKGNDIVDADGDLYTSGFTPKKRNELLSAKAVDEICALVEAGEEVHAWLVGAAMQELLIRTADSDAIVRVLGNDPFANMHTITISDMYALYAYNPVSYTHLDVYKRQGLDMWRIV